MFTPTVAGVLGATNRARWAVPEDVDGPALLGVEGKIRARYE